MIESIQMILSKDISVNNKYPLFHTLYVLFFFTSFSLHAAILDDLVEKIQTPEKHYKHHRKNYRHTPLSQEAKWQTSLQFLGYYKGKIDGDLFTQESFDAITAFHHDHDQIDTGFLEEEDKRYLSKIYRTISLKQYLSYHGDNKRQKAKKLQAALKALSFYQGEIDGYFKKGSKKALTRYKMGLDSNLSDEEIEKRLLDEAEEKIASDIEKIKKEDFDPLNYAE